MGRRNRQRERDIERDVQRAANTSLSRAGTIGQGVDLSPAASRARAQAKRRTGSDGGLTGRELIEKADLVLARANRLAKVAQRDTNSRKRRQRADQQSDELLRNAAAQIRIAELTPLDRPYLHALTIEQVQTVKAEVIAAFQRSSAALAVDTLRRITDQRARVRAEGNPRR